MSVQNIIVAVIVLAALAYVGQIVWRRAKSFSTKSGCGASCGCASEIKTKNLKQDFASHSSNKN